MMKVIELSVNKKKNTLINRKMIKSNVKRTKKIKKKNKHLLIK